MVHLLHDIDMQTICIVIFVTLNLLLGMQQANNFEYSFSLPPLPIPYFSAQNLDFIQRDKSEIEELTMVDRWKDCSELD
jgi:hypothetical protein